MEKKLKYTRQEALDRADYLMRRGNHCGPTVLQVMWESTGLGSEDLLWASMTFNGGIGSQRQAVCGALSGAAVYLGLRRRVPMIDTEQAHSAKELARKDAAQVVQEFTRLYGKIICQELVGIDFSDSDAVAEYGRSGDWINKCSGIVQSVIACLYDSEEK